MPIEELLKKKSHIIEEPVFNRIRRRLIEAGRRFHANDNISDFIQKDELIELHKEIEKQIKGLLETLVIDTVNDHNTIDTAKRVAKMLLREVFRGRYEPAPEITSFPNVSRLNELLTVGPVTVRSACAHHLCPIMGRLWIGIVPNASSDLIGLSKYSRLADWIMSRPQIQEEAVIMLADELERRLSPDGLALVMEATHFCMRWRGVKENSTLMRSSVMRGTFLKNSQLSIDFLNYTRS